MTQLRRLSALMLLMYGCELGAQAAATIPASSRVYDRLEAVSALFPVRGLFLGERALSRREVERVIARLSAAVNSAAEGPRKQWARAELREIESNLESRRGIVRRTRGVAGVDWRADVFSSHAQTQRIDSNGLGAIDAVSHPFGAGRHGWPLVQGTIATIAPTFMAGRASGIAAAAQPNASLTAISEGGWTSDRLLARGYVRGAYRNVGVQVGAEELRWGQSPWGSMFISGTTRPFPAVSLSTDTAIVLPWIFRYVGPLRLTGLLADLGGTQVPLHTRLAGWQASIQPWTRFELGVAVLLQTGGDGGPKATFLERLIDLFPALDAVAPQHADLQISNKLAGGNLRLRIPEWSGLDFYYELQIDDFDGRRLRSSLVEDAGHLLGLRLPLQFENRQLVTRLEWHHTSIRLYEHAQFRSGTTYRQQIIGNPLGPHAAAGYGSLTWRWSPSNSIELGAADERRDPAQYTVIVSGDRDRGWTFVRLTDDPDHRRRRFTATLEHALPVGGGALRLTIGNNRSWRTGQAGRADWAGLLSVTSHRLSVF